MIAAWISAGHAEPEELEDPRARAHFERAAALWQAGDYEQADAALAAAAAIEATPALRYAQGQLARELGDCERALEFYRQFLETTEPNTRAREEVLMNMARCQAATELPATEPPAPEPVPDPAPVEPVPDRPPRRMEPATVGLLVAGSVTSAAALGLGIAAGLELRAADDATQLDAFEGHRRRSRIELGVGVAAGSVGIALLVAGIVRGVRHRRDRALGHRLDPWGPLRF